MLSGQRVWYYPSGSPFLGVATTRIPDGVRARRALTLFSLNSRKKACMEFYRYLNVVRKRLPLIIALTVLGAASAFFFSSRQPKIYSARVTLSINAAAPSQLVPYLNPSTGASSANDLSSLASTYGVLLTQRSFDTTVLNEPVIGPRNQKLSDLDKTLTAGALGSHVTSALVPNTSFFGISVSWTNAQRAADIANGIATVFIKENQRLQTLQATASVSATSPELTASIAYFRGRYNGLLARFNRLLNNPRSSPVQVNQVSIDLNTVGDTYFKLLGQLPSTTSLNGVSTATITDAAVPGPLVSPNTRTNTFFGLLAGLLVGLALAYALDYLDYSLRTPEDLEQLIGQAPLGIVNVIERARPARGLALFGRRGTTPPAAMPPSNGASGSLNANFVPLTVLSPQLVTLNAPHSSTSEAFRALRTNLEFTALDNPLKSLVVTSSLPGEGKSTVAANLAIALAQAGKRVILVDADLRRPTQAKLFNLDKTTGLTTVLLNREDRSRALGEALQATMVPNLLVMPSGPHPPNPAELLASESISPVMRDLEARADIVIYDTPPMGPLTDAVVLSARVSGTLVVVRAGSTRRSVITNSQTTLKKVGGNVLGVVMNGVNAKDISNYSYYYYYQSEYYSRQDEPLSSARRNR